MNLYSLLSNEITQEDLLNYYNATITIQFLPEEIEGCVFSYKDIYNIFINKNLSYERKKLVILHELAHIELNHHNQINKDLLAFKTEKLEDEADLYIEKLIDKLKH